MKRIETLLTVTARELSNKYPEAAAVTMEPMPRARYVMDAFLRV